ncbi:MAG TPA: XrtA system polysaccharide chain length determinant [Gammaproteobacteria bacterium]
MSLPEQIEILKKESARRMSSIATTVLITSLVMLALGLLWNEKYESSSAILIEDERIIGSLLDGTTVPTRERAGPDGIVDHAEIAREVLFDREVMNAVAEEAGWLTEEMTPIERAELIDMLKKRLKVENIGANVIELSFRDTLPERAFRTVLALTNLFIERAHEANTAESRAAYEFLSGEVERYREKLLESEQRLQSFYAEHGNIQPGTGDRVDTRVVELMRDMQATSLDLEEARARVRALEAQLSGDASSAVVITQRDQIRTAIAEQQAQLAALRLQYHDTYPDVVTAKQKIEALRAQLRDLDEGGAPANADSALFVNPLREELRAELSAARTEVAALQERLARNEAWLDDERGRGVEVSGIEAQAAELTREYEVTRDFYQELVQRRESARIALNMDREGEAVSMSVQEPPTVPQQPSGLRFVHFALLGPLLGLGLAFGVLFMRVRFDERIRTSSTISRELQIPVLTTVPMLVDERARSRQRRVRGTVVAAGLMLLACYALVAALRMNDFL